MTSFLISIRLVNLTNRQFLWVLSTTLESTWIEINKTSLISTRSSHSEMETTNDNIIIRVTKFIK